MVRRVKTWDRFGEHRQAKEPERPGRSGVKNAEENGALDKGAAEFGGETVGNYSNYLGNPGRAGRPIWI